MEVFAIGIEEACEGSDEGGADLVGAEGVRAGEVDGGETSVVNGYAAFCLLISMVAWSCRRCVGIDLRMHLNDSS